MLSLCVAAKIFFYLYPCVVRVLSSEPEMATGQRVEVQMGHLGRGSVDLDHHHDFLKIASALYSV